MVNLEWSEWSKDEYPSMSCNYDGFMATVQLVDTCRETGYNNRQWTVANRDKVVIATGYTLTTVHATMMVEIALHVNGVLNVAHKLAQMVIKHSLVRQG